MARPDFVAVYPSKCGKLAMCRMESQGQWFRMQMLMCESTRYGHLCTQDGSSLPTEIAARGCGLEVAHYELGLAELSSVGLIHRDVNGVIFDPDMVEFAKRWCRLVHNSDDLHERKDCDRERKRRSSTHVSGVISSSLSLDSISKEFKKVIPKWLKQEQWEKFVEMRAKIRAPLTPYAAHCIIRDLEKIGAEGGNPIMALDKTIKNSWRGVFEQKGNGDEPIGRRQREADRAAKEAIRRMG